jgi:hypothetical protein
VAPTYQQDIGGLGIGSSGLWPVTPFGVVRLAWAVPNDLQTFQRAELVLIPHTPGGAGTLNVFVCRAQNSDLVGAACTGPVPYSMVGAAGRVLAVDTSTAIAPHVGAAGLNYLAVLAYTTPTTATDHILGLRFVYDPVLPAGVATLAANTFSGTQTAPAFAGSGSGLTNVNANLLDGLDSTAFAATVHGHTVSQVTGAAKLAGGNAFTGTQAIGGGNLDLGFTTATAGNIMKNGERFLTSVGGVNTFLGEETGSLAVSGTFNTGIGYQALRNITSGFLNTASGSGALENNTTGVRNTATGSDSLRLNTEGTGNTASGVQALQNNTTGFDNTASGSSALVANTTGDQNTAIGKSALGNNTRRVNSARYPRPSASRKTSTTWLTPAAGCSSSGR